MKKWIIGILVVGMLGFAVFNFVDNKSKRAENNQAPTSSEVESKQEPATAKVPNVEKTNQVGLEAGMAAPDFTLETLDGETVSLSDYQGQKVLLNFWATWCPPCRDEMPDMQKFHEDYGDDVTILGVNLTETELSEENIQSFLDEMGADFTILKDMDTSIGLMYQAQALPTSYIIDREGSIVNKAIGPLTYEAMVDVFGQIE